MTDMDTDRRLRAALLPYQPRLLHDVLDSLDVAVVVLDDTCRVLAGNVAASRLLGIRRGRREGDAPSSEITSIADESGDDLDPTDYHAWRDRATAGQALTVRVTYEDGSARWFHVTAQLVPGATDDALVCRYADVTAKRELERRAAAAADQAARAEIDLVAAEKRVALLEELLVYVTTRGA
jgi:PAS domain S-box-containing protein